jgi:hypothetical protein
MTDFNRLFDIVGIKMVELYLHRWGPDPIAFYEVIFVDVS